MLQTACGLLYMGMLISPHCRRRLAPEGEIALIGGRPSSGFLVVDHVRSATFSYAVGISLEGEQKN